MVRDLRWHTKLILDPNGRENAAELRKIRSSDIPLHQCPVKRIIKKQGGRKENNNISQHVTRMRFLLKMVMSVIQLSLHGAVADMIQELLDDQIARGTLVALDQTEQEILIQRPIVEQRTNDERQGNLLQDYEQRSERRPGDQKLSKLCSESGLRLVEVGQFFYALPSLDEPKNQSSCREYASPRDEEKNCA